MSQNDRVLARLRLGPVAAVEFQPPNVCDGGTPIWRVAARIDVLKSRGYSIVSERRPDGTAVYRLLGEPERAAAEGGLQPVAHCEGPGAPDAAPGTPSPSPAEARDDSLFDSAAFGAPRAAATGT